ncbi:unnamed protein product [Pleuronectes platessa]|uniref:Uncharacterized protein n=1 Tax=Pleuronectes platessa TaxID=8262 RepID=A0A9N7UUM8_PLEPL|nr:unnamed protein product [Pleuronectes platessa]
MSPPLRGREVEPELQLLFPLLEFVDFDERDVPTAFTSSPLSPRVCRSDGTCGLSLPSTWRPEKVFVKSSFKRLRRLFYRGRFREDRLLQTSSSSSSLICPHISSVSQPQAAPGEGSWILK